MSQIFNDKTVAHKYKGRVIERYIQIWIDLESAGLKEILGTDCKCYNPSISYFEGLEEIIGCHDVWFKRITETLAPDIEISWSRIKKGKNGFNQQSKVKVYSEDNVLLFEFLVSHSDTSISEIIIIGEKYSREIMNNDLDWWNEEQVQLNLSE